MAFDILIVDDEADIRHLIAGILEDEGYESREAGGDKVRVVKVNGVASVDAIKSEISTALS